MKSKLALSVFTQLLRRDLMAFRKDFRSKLIDTFILFLTNTLVFSYFMSGEGLRADYGSFIVIGSIASFGLIEVVGKVSLLLSDFEGERAISQVLIMPIRSELVFTQIAVYWAISSILLSVLLFPLGKIVLLDKFDMSQFCYWRLIPMYITANLYYGFFALWLSSIIRGMGGINGLWMRFIAPMWMFGAYFYSWKSVFEVHPVIGYLSLLNPMVYVMEGMRAASLGQEGYLPFWVSFLVTWGIIFACASHGTARLKKKLDVI